jgi:uncharacterized coiled-coil DUF342 family protein
MLQANVDADDSETIQCNCCMSKEKEKKKLEPKIRRLEWKLKEGQLKTKANESDWMQVIADMDNPKTMITAGLLIKISSVTDLK